MPKVKRPQINSLVLQDDSCTPIVRIILGTTVSDMSPNQARELSAKISREAAFAESESGMLRHLTTKMAFKEAAIIVHQCRLESVRRTAENN